MDIEVIVIQQFGPFVEQSLSNSLLEFYHKDTLSFLH